MLQTKRLQRVEKKEVERRVEAKRSPHGALQLEGLGWCQRLAATRRVIESRI